METASYYPVISVTLVGQSASYLIKLAPLPWWALPSSQQSKLAAKANGTPTDMWYSALGASTKRERIAMLKKAFLFVSGGNLYSFINHFLTQTEFEKTELLPAVQNKELNGILENLKDLLESSPQKHL
ncbi:hypothetical protein DSO57_1005123 [Entomophthora muscae]|uniref:Uncharacterized protein n=1 Tax=Entomophthora muscae TaxID=34485 RepID=A0ACC2SA81_9FUNG|nr:hypothetical protein DSO57_1005123 [Entomophthora muscae]